MRKHSIKRKHSAFVKPTKRKKQRRSHKLFRNKKGQYTKRPGVCYKKASCRQRKHSIKHHNRKKPVSHILQPKVVTEPLKPVQHHIPMAIN